eukprot:SAG31_NODE_6725_length_1909_cov_2.502210_1_plen_234_part_00
MYPRDRVDVASAQLVDQIDSLGTIECGTHGRFTSRGTCECTGGYSGTRCTVITPAEAAAQLKAQADALLAFKASGGAATATALASWRNGTDSCGGGTGCGHFNDTTGDPTDAPCPWVGVTCSGGAAPAVTELRLCGSCGGSGPQFPHVAGQIGTLAPLTHLTVLDLYDTKVTGQAAALAPLKRLTYLDLDGTAVAGCGAFCGAGGPFYTNCGSPTCGCTVRELRLESCGFCGC